MSKREIFISRTDLKRLLELIDLSRQLSDRPNVYIKRLETELKSARIVEPRDIPGDVVTLNSTIRIMEFPSEEEKTFKLVLPAHATDRDATVSILSPLGTALIGYRQGDTVEWKTHKGTLTFTIQEIIYQPERAGVYDL